MSAFKSRLGVNEVTDNKSNLGKSLIAELIGNFMLNFFGCMSAVTPNTNNVLIAFTFGLTIMALVQSVGHVSGAHINPAVTFGCVVTGKVTIIRALLYILSQCIGAIGGSATMKALLSESVIAKGVGNTGLAPYLTSVQGFGIEFFLGFILVFVVFGACDANKGDSKPPAAVLIGLTVTLGHLVAIDYTGASMNPARSFGSAIIANGWANHWIYWVGPSLGGIAAALLYQHVFAAPSKGEYSPVQVEEKELKRLDGKNEDGVA
ncbi:aquaporin prip isoform X2 [Lycorma delicatula]